MITRIFTARRLGGLLRQYPQANAYKASQFPALTLHQSTSFSTTSTNAMKVLAILYDGGEPARNQPRLLGTTENKLGLEEYFKNLGHEFIVTSDKEGPGSAFQRHIVDADILITTPFHPGYLTADLVEKAQNLKLAVTAGVGSDHIDLNAAARKGITVAEVSGSNVVSVAEHVVMSILLLVRNYEVGHAQIGAGTWQVAAAARDAYDLEGKVVGTIGAGRIGYRVLERLKPFNCKELLYYDYAPLTPEREATVGARRVTDLHDFLSQCDVVTVNCPLHEGTRGLINAETISHMKQNAWLVNTARGAICDAEAVHTAVTSGKLLGYAGDVWNQQPAPQHHPWRYMRNPNGGGNGLVPHYSGTTLDAQARYAAGVKDIIHRFLNQEEQDPGNLIVAGGGYATKAYGQR